MMQTIYDFVIDYVLVTAWLILSGVYRAARRELRRFVIFELKLVGTCLALMAVGWIFKLQLCVIIGSYLAAIIFIATWYLGDEAAAIICSLTSTVPLVNRIATPITAETKKLLRPLVFLSMTLAFVGAVTSIIGIRHTTIQMLMVWTGVGLFFGVFGAYLGIVTKIPGYAMALVLLYLLVGRYMMPVQVAGRVSAANAWMMNASLNKQYAAREAEIINIPVNTPLYERIHGEFRFTERSHKEKTTKAKVISQVKDDSTGEELYQVVLQVESNVYVGGRQVYVPVRRAEPAKSLMQVASDTPVPGSTRVFGPGTYNFPVDPGPDTGSVVIASGCTWNLAAKGPGKYDLLPENGEVIEFHGEGSKHAKFPNQFIAYKIRAIDPVVLELKVNRRVEKFASL